MNVGIIGCGLIGRKRSMALCGCRLITCTDVNPESAKSLAADFSGVEVVADHKEVICNPDVEIVIVATSHDALAEITLSAVKAGKHVLVEKPGGRGSAEIAPVIDAVKDKGVRVHVGFNHRYHPSFIQAGKIVDTGELGDLLYIRARYGHGARIGYEKEWRADRAISGGGELIDQGMHLIDLSRSFLGEFTDIQGFCPTYFWDMEVEDNGFMLLKTNNNQAAFLHASWTEWKNKFSFELFGKYGKLEISGLGGSYGTEKLAYYKMLPQMGPPETTIWEYPGKDRSWETEFEAFLTDIKTGRHCDPGLEDAFQAFKIVEKVYEGNEK